MAQQTPPLLVPKSLFLSSLTVTQTLPAVWAGAAVTHPCDIGYVASWLEQVYTDFTIKWQHALGSLPAHRHEKPVPSKFLPRLMGCSLTQHPATISIPRSFLTVWARSTIAAMESHGELLVSGDKLLSLFLSFFSKKRVQLWLKHHEYPIACEITPDRAF